MKPPKATILAGGIAGDRIHELEAELEQLRANTQVQRGPGKPSQFNQSDL